MSVSRPARGRSLSQTAAAPASSEEANDGDLIAATSEELPRAQSPKPTVDWPKLLAKLNKYCEKSTAVHEGSEIYELFRHLVKPQR